MTSFFPISFTERIFHPLERLDSQERKKVIIATVVCGILFPIIGGVIALYTASTIFKNRHIQQLVEDPLKGVATAIITPGTPTKVSPHCTELLDCFGLRPDSPDTFDSNKLSNLVEKLLQHTPNEILDTTSKLEIVQSSDKLEAFLQRVNDYNLSLFFPVNWTVNPPADPKAKLSQEVSFIKQELVKEDSPYRKQTRLMPPANKVTCIPQEVFQCSQLQSLWVTSEVLCGVSSKLGTLTNLKDLSITSSKILSEIPPEIDALKNLTAINFTGLIQLKELPDQIGNLPQLETLMLVKSGITFLPESIAQLPSLKFLLCTDCKQLQIPSALDKQLKTKLGLRFQTGSVLPQMLKKS